jgi:2-polyprenyl-3-methyl-5-hydroxy-6-metoxy-1,4-benzoquinol methylase
MTKDSFVAETNSNDQYSQINQTHYLSRNEIIPSKRKFLGPIINLYKRIMIRLLYPPLAQMIQVQNDFNSDTVQLLNALREQLATLVKKADENQKTAEEVLTIEKKMLELNHYRYMETKDVEKKMLELNHDRYMEYKQLEHLFHTELLNIKKQLGDIVFTCTHLQNHTDFFHQNLETMQQKLDRLEVDIRTEQESQVMFQKQLFGMESKLQDQLGQTAQWVESIPHSLKEAKESLRSDVHDQQIRLNQAFASLSTLRKIMMTGSLSLRSQRAKVLELGFESEPEFEVLSENIPGRPDSNQDQIFFELAERFRGTEEEILARQRVYLEYLEGKTPIIDVGCGRGEMLEQLSRKGWEAIGVENNALMARYCVSKGLKVINEDALHYLEGFGQDSAGSIFASHFVEHVDLDSMLKFLVLAMSRLKDNGILIIETPNPTGLCIFSQSFYLDPSHIRPIHPEAMQLLLESIGFKIVKVLYLSPWPEETKLGPLPSDGGVTQAFAGVIERLNNLLFAPRDYSIIATK